MASHEVYLRREIVNIGRKMANRGFVCATEGNISCALEDGTFLITPSGKNKGELGPAEILKINSRGEKISGWGKPSSETAMHLKVYQLRKDVKGVVHAHPPTLIAFSLAGISLAGCVIPEIVMALGKVPSVGYATPGTGEASVIIEGPIQEFNALLLDFHGSLTVGSSLEEAYYHLERIEQAAKITWMARQLGDIRSLPPGERERLDQMRLIHQGKLPPGCNQCGLCPKGKTQI
ncbi:MAG: class II aldolase/adducin family protein [Planctomycetota bacterium]|nr:MAG: class II aldolase/adducin family protein [Planctomycetota bacterium]